MFGKAQIKMDSNTDKKKDDLMFTYRNSKKVVFSQVLLGPNDVLGQV